MGDAIARVRADHPRVGGLGWDFDGFRVWVDSNAPGVLVELERYFAGFRRVGAESLADTRISVIESEAPGFAADGAPTIRSHKESGFDVADGRVVHKLRTGMWFAFGRDEGLAIGPCTRHLNQVTNFIVSRMIQWALDGGALLGHASAVCRAQPGAPLARAIAIAGFSGMGKSTLALHLMHDPGIDFVSNDRVLIHPRRGDAPAQIEGVPKHPRVNPGTILHNPKLAGILADEEGDRLERLEPAALWQLEDKHDALIHECFPDQRFCLRAELVGLLLLDWRHGQGPTTAARIDLRSRRELLGALIKDPGLFHLPGAERPASQDPDRYLEALGELATVQLSGGVDFDHGRAAALELLGV